MEWSELFDRAAEYDRSTAAIETAIETARNDRDGRDRSPNTVDPTPGAERPTPRPYRIVADADVLVFDLLVDGDARRALEAVWRHSWVELLASDRLIGDAATAIGSCTDRRLAEGWRSAIDEWRTPVVHPDGDHPALASAYRGGAMHVLTRDDRLTAAGTGAALRGRFPVSVRDPAAFAAVFDPESLYGEFDDDVYPGPDRSPRRR